MTDQSIFNNNEGNGNPSPASNENEALTTLLASVKNDQGEPKYDSIPKALEGLRNAQEYIPQLKQDLSEKDKELEELRSKVAELSAVNDVVDRLAAPKEEPAKETPPQQQTFDEQTIADLLQKQLDQRDKKLTAEANTKEVVTALSEKFGTEAEKVYTEKAAELGLTVDALNELTAQSPKAVLAYFGGSVKKDPTPFAGGGQNTSGFEPPQETSIKRNDESVMSGFYSTEDLRAESKRAKQLVEELHAAGMDTWDLADPKNYAKVFGKL